MLNGSPVEEADIATEAGGRPFLPGRKVDFGITHSGCLTAVSFAGGVNLRTSCDVEHIRPRTGAAEIAENFFSPNETKYLFDAGKFNETKFYEIWTLKECFIKLMGLSVFDMAGVPSFISQSLEFEFTAAAPLPLSFRLYELSGKVGLTDNKEHYMLATVIEDSCKQCLRQSPEIVWFSKPSFVCKLIACL